ncbi:MAG: hypothetical protein IKN93_04935 [Bacteroidales bacterium]|nr:hypothetical protein [Bacteroidales bacterium]
MHSGPGWPSWTGGMASAALMRELGYDCEAFVCSKTNNETNFISSYFGFDLPELKPSVPEGTYILYYGEGARETAEEAYGASLRDGVCYSEERLGRKNAFVPTIERILSKAIEV